MKFKLSLKEILEITGGELIGNDDIEISKIERIESFSKNSVCFLNSEDYLKYLKKKQPKCLIVKNTIDYKPQKNNTAIFVANAYQSYVRLLIYIDQKFNAKQKGIHPSAIIAISTKIGENVRIEPYVVIGENCKIGKNTIIYPNVTIYDDTIIGENCIIHSGSVIGSDGFGYIEKPDGEYIKIPQLGNVEIGNNVEIGANTCIDRAIAGSTIIADGVKLDNLVHIAHNSEIGENTAFAAQVGVAGSIKVGKRVRMGGQSASVGHIEIVDDVIIIAKSGVAKSILEKGIYFGSPAKPRLEAFKIESSLKYLPELVKKLK